MIYPSVYQLGCAVQAQLGQHNAAAMRLPTLQKTDGGPTLHPLSVFGTRAQCEAAAGYDLKETLIWAGLPTTNVRRFARDMSAKKRASDAKWTITLAGVLWLVAKTTTAPQFQFVHDQTLQMARLDGEAPDNASDDEGRAALQRGPRTGLADMTRPAQRRREVWKALHRLIAPDGSRQAMVDGLAQLFESDEGMLARVVAGSSHALRDHLHQEFTAGAAMAKETMCGFLRSMMSARAYKQCRDFEAALELQFLGFDGVLTLPGARAQDAYRNSLPPLPPFTVTMEEGRKSVGISVKIADVLRYVLQFEEVRAALGGDYLLIKVCGDAAKLIKKENVTALSVVLLFPGCGTSVKSVSVASLYFGDDHGPKLRAHLQLGALSELVNLQMEGLRGAPGVLHEFPVPVRFWIVPDGAIERELLANSSAASTYPIPGIPITSHDLSTRIFDGLWQLDGQEIDRIEASVVLDGAWSVSETVAPP